jgi:hypothetical protein
MKPTHLGDAHDLAKKDILKTLKAGLKERIYVIAMFTHVFDEEQLAFYKHLTCADEIKTEKFEHGTREAYFQIYLSMGLESSSLTPIPELEINPKREKEESAFVLMR